MLLERILRGFEMNRKERRAAKKKNVSESDVANAALGCMQDAGIDPSTVSKYLTMKTKNDPIRGHKPESWLTQEEQNQLKMVFGTHYKYLVVADHGEPVCVIFYELKRAA